ncbi:MAG: hypothetical protein ABJF23_26605 [Bryobacteraceae bacterium]
MQRRCLLCHKPDGIGPMPLVTYDDVKIRAAAVRESVISHQMPPWFADSRYGEFANDPHLSDEEIRTIDTWERSGAPAGTPPNRSGTAVDMEPEHMSADLVVSVPNSIPIPISTTTLYKYLILPLPFAYDRWVRGAEIRPTHPAAVHHAVLYLREPQSSWLRNVATGVPYSPSGPETLIELRKTSPDILAIYTPGATAPVYPEGMARKIPAGSDLVLQLHYRSSKTPGTDQPQIGLVMANGQPKKQILTSQIGRHDWRILPGEASDKPLMSDTLLAEVVLLSIFPPMHPPGTQYGFEAADPDRGAETLLQVKPYRSGLLLNYVLKTPRLLHKGTVLRWTRRFDKATEDAHGTAPATGGAIDEQNWDEMVTGFIDIAIDSGIDRRNIFRR